MNKQTVLDLIDEAIAELITLRADVDGGLIVRIRDGWHGHPRSPNLDPGTSRPAHPETLPDELRGTLGYSDPVGSVVAATGARDSAQNDAREVIRAVTATVRQLRRARDVRSRYKLRAASLFDQEHASTPEPGCASCARVASPGTVGKPKTERSGWWNPIVRNVTLHDGRNVGLCEWCRVRVRETGTLPDVVDVESYRDTGKARRRSA